MDSKNETQILRILEPKTKVTSVYRNGDKGESSCSTVSVR